MAEGYAERAEHEPGSAVVSAAVPGGAAPASFEGLAALVGAVGHDCNNLLGGILNLAQLISAGLADLADGPEAPPAVVTARADADEVARSARRAADRIEELLAALPGGGWRRGEQEVLTPDTLRDDLTTVGKGPEPQEDIDG